MPWLSDLKARAFSIASCWLCVVAILLTAEAGDGAQDAKNVIELGSIAVADIALKALVAPVCYSSFTTEPTLPARHAGSSEANNPMPSTVRATTTKLCQRKEIG